MRIVVFGLSISSSWGNGHATLWRGLIQALARRGCSVIFFERDLPYYAAHRDSLDPPGCSLIIYSDWADVRSIARRELADADVAIVTSYCPDGIEATALVLDAPRCLHVFYDLDTPITLSRVNEGYKLTYIDERGLADFDLVLSYTGGEALAALRTQLGARTVAPLYGHVDPGAHSPVDGMAEFTGDLSYLGTYAEDRQPALLELLLGSAIRSPAKRFVMGGAQYPDDFPWASNVHFVRHLPPSLHSAFYCSSPLTLNITRRPMAQLGWCPSARLFEAAACGTAVITDQWEGLSDFYEPGKEIVVVNTSDDVLAALSMDDKDVHRIAARARDRTLAEHTSQHRADEFIALIEQMPHKSQVMGELAAQEV